MQDIAQYEPTEPWGYYVWLVAMGVMLVIVAFVMYVTFLP